MMVVKNIAFQRMAGIYDDAVEFIQVRQVSSGK